MHCAVCFLFPIFYRCNILNSLLGIDKSTGQFTFHSAGVSSVSSSSSSCYSFSFYHELLPSFSFGYTTCYYWRGRKRGKLAATAAPRPFRCSSLAVQVDNGCLCFGADFDFLSLLYLSLSLSHAGRKEKCWQHTRHTLADDKPNLLPSLPIFHSIIHFTCFLSLWIPVVRVALSATE